jgi:cytochrome P450
MDILVAAEPLLDALVGGSARAGEPPLVRGRVPFVGCAVAFGRDAPAFLSACRARHGDVFTLLVAGRRMTFVLDPHAVPAVLQQEGLAFTELAFELSARIFGHPPVWADAVPEILRITKDHLKGEALAELSARTRERIDAMLSAPRAGGTVHGLRDFVDQVLFVAGADTLYGEGFSTPEVVADFARFDRAFPLLAAGVPAALLPGVRSARERLAMRLAARRAGDSRLHRERRALLGARFGALEIGRAELSVLWAALANTVAAAFWTVAHLLADRAACDAVTREVRAAGAGGPLLQSAVSEALRLSSASLTVRRAQRATTLALGAGVSWPVRRGDLVCVFPYLTHHDPEVYPDPESFRVDRFHGGESAPRFEKGGKRLAVPLMPYGGGASLCPGRLLAAFEIKQFVAALLRDHDVEMLDAALPALDRRRAGLGVLPPLGDVRFRLHRARA